MSFIGKATSSYILYQEAKSALKLLNPSTNELGLLYALECIIEGRTIKLRRFPLSRFKNTLVERIAYGHLQTPKYTLLIKEQAVDDYIQYVKALLANKHMHIRHANNILNDSTIGMKPIVTKF